MFCLSITEVLREQVLTVVHRTPPSVYQGLYNPLNRVVEAAHEMMISRKR